MREPPDKIGCAFCDALAMHKWANSILQCDHGADDQVLHAYSTALIIHSWLKSMGKASASRLVDYRHKGLGFKLNYCPECGRQMKRGKK